MKKKILYVAALVICLCLFSNASKECGKITGESSSCVANAKNKNTEAKRIEQEDSKTEFSLANLLFLQTI
jgi:hypothetical protein